MNEKTLIEFAALLREGGMRVAMSEIADALRGLAFCGVEKATFYTVLAATLCKDECDREIFDAAFRLCFGGSQPEPALFDKNCDGGDGEALCGGGGLTDAARSFLGALAGRNESALLRQAEECLADLTEADASVEEQLHAVKVKLGWFMVTNALERDENDRRPERIAMERLEQRIRRRLERTQAQKRGAEELLRSLDLNEKPLDALSEREVAAMELRLARLGRKLAARYSYRLRPARHGVIHMRRLLGETARRGCLPARLPRIDRRRDRPELVVLCDISGSVAIYSSFLMQLVCAASRGFSRLRAFLFVDDLAEVTDTLREGSAAEAVRRAIEASHVVRTGVSKQHCSRAGLSDYGRVLTIFRRDYGDLLNDKTTLLIMGDGRNNWFAPQAEELHTLAQRCHRVLWLNPEPRSRWQEGDCVLLQYAPCCDDILECRNLAGLERAVAQIL